MLSKPLFKVCDINLVTVCKDFKDIDVLEKVEKRGTNFVPRLRNVGQDERLEPLQLAADEQENGRGE